MLKTDHERFQTAKPGRNFYRPETGDFSCRLSWKLFSRRPRPEMGVPFRINRCPEMASGVWIFILTGFHPLWEATSVAIRRKQHLLFIAVSAQQANRCLAESRYEYPPTHASGSTTSRRDRIVMVTIVYESLVLCHARSCGCSIHLYRTNPSLVVEDEDS